MHSDDNPPQPGESSVASHPWNEAPGVKSIPPAPRLSPSMLSTDPVLLREIPVIQKIIADETWLEGERRGCFVPPSDRVVRERVCAVILRVGQQLRDSITATMTGEVRPQVDGPAGRTPAASGDPIRA